MSIEVGDAAPVVNVEAYVKGEAGPVPMRIGGSSCSWTVLFFYPRDYAYAYPPELRGFSELQAAFALEGASLVAASMDSWHVHRAWFGTSPGSPRSATRSSRTRARSSRAASACSTRRTARRSARPS